MSVNIDSAIDAVNRKWNTSNNDTTRAGATAAIEDMLTEVMNKDSTVLNTSGSTAGMPSAAKKYIEDQNKKSVQYLKKNGANGMPNDAMIGYKDLKAATQGIQNVPKKNTSKNLSGSSSSSTTTRQDLSVGDKVQIKDGGIDVTNGAKAKKGKMYGENGPLWATITSITENYATGSKWGLPAKVTKVQCSNNNVVVWNVADSDIAKQSIKPDKIDKKAVTGKNSKDKNTKKSNKNNKVQGAKYDYDKKRRRDIPIESLPGPFTPDGGSDKWYEGFDSTTVEGINEDIERALAEEAYISDSFYDSDASVRTPTYEKISGPRKDDDEIYDDVQYQTLLVRNGYSEEEARKIMKQQRKRGASPAGINTGAVEKAIYNTNWSNPGRRHELMNDDETLIQNPKNFPPKIEDAYYGKTNQNGYTTADPECAKYDYQIKLDDDRLKYNKKKSFEDRLADARAQFGLPVHGDTGLAKYMKMYMYNRFKVPDINLALTKTFTHVFFTRPDLNLMDGPSTANWQSRNHTDSALIWRTHPELFKLLTDYRRCGDNDNFNLLLSNNVLQFTLDDEKLATNRAGGSWAGHEMTYGEQYNGRTSGEFTCSFLETSNLDIITLMKLWITYIDNVGRGAWSPYYYTKDGGMTVTNHKTQWCHVFDRALDYAASAYVFVCGADGETILYWSKYYGVFPISTGSSALSWDSSTPIGDASKININFSYSCKKDLSPISLLEFNNISNVKEATQWMPGWNKKYAGSGRPYVGSPFIEIDLGTPIMDKGDVDRGGSKETKLRLKFKKPPYEKFKIAGKSEMAAGDAVLFRSTYEGFSANN